jgi:Flp pilus assembly protein TadG
MKRLLSQLRANERGAAILELALAAPVLAALIVGLTDVSRAYAMKLRLAQAAQRTIERIQVNGKNTNDYTTLSAEGTAAATAAGYSDSTVVVNYKLECNGTTKTSNTTGAAINVSCDSGQTYARYVTVTISNYYTPVFGTRYFPGANAQGQVAVSGYAGLRVQ